MSNSVLELRIGTEILIHSDFPENQCGFKHLSETVNDYRNKKCRIIAIFRDSSTIYVVRSDEYNPKYNESNYAYMMSFTYTNTLDYFDYVVGTRLIPTLWTESSDPDTVKSRIESIKKWTSSLESEETQISTQISAYEARATALAEAAAKNAEAASVRTQVATTNEQTSWLQLDIKCRVCQTLYYECLFSIENLRIIIQNWDMLLNGSKELSDAKKNLNEAKSELSYAQSLANKNSTLLAQLDTFTAKLTALKADLDATLISAQE